MKKPADLFRYVFDRFYIGALTGLIVSDAVNSILPKHGVWIAAAAACGIYMLGTLVADVIHKD